MVANAVAPNSRLVCFLLIAFFSLERALITVSRALGKGELETLRRDAACEAADISARRKSQRVNSSFGRGDEFPFASPTRGEGKSPQLLVATTTRPGTGTLSSLRADKSSSSDNLRPADATDART